MRAGERMVTLVDGSEVSNYSAEWREECEAREVCRLRGYWTTDSETGRRYHINDRLHRRMYMREVEKRRGREARERLEACVHVVWRAEFATDRSSVEIDHSSASAGLRA